MGTAALLECSFLIPIWRDRNLSDGELHKREAWRWLRTLLYRRFEGATFAPGLHSGVYKDPDTGKPVEDKSRKYIVAIPEKQLKQLRALLSEACIRFAQKSIYLSVAGRVEFVEAPRDGRKKRLHRP